MTVGINSTFISPELFSFFILLMVKDLRANSKQIALMRGRICRETGLFAA